MATQSGEEPNDQVQVSADELPHPALRKICHAVIALVRLTSVNSPPASPPPLTVPPSSTSVHGRPTDDATETGGAS
jgi:hypothetical protein